jgi:hypothetical protein
LLNPTDFFTCPAFSGLKGKIMSAIERVIPAKLSRFVKPEAREEFTRRISSVVQTLDERYDLANKVAKEPGTLEIILQLFERLIYTYGDLSSISGKRILDIACGSNTSKAPTTIHIRTPFRKKVIHPALKEGYTAQFEPWFCRILLALDAHPVGVDIGDLDGEAFEHYQADLGREGALDFFPDHSFDGIQDSRLFGSPEFTTQFPRRADRLKVAREIRDQERRLLKEGGVLIHSDARDLLN